jgi:hypothetical protein
VQLLLARRHLLFVELQVLIIAALLHLLHEVLILGFHSGVILLVLMIVPADVYGAEYLPHELIPTDTLLFPRVIYGTTPRVSDLMMISPYCRRFPS